jgi:hypothetical protein
MRNLTFPSVLVTLMLLALVTGCTPGKVISTELGPGIQESNYQTYNFYDLKVDAPDTMPTRPERVQMLKDAISRELQAVGLQMADDPDLWVNIGVVVERKIQTRETDIREAPIYIGQRNYHWEVEEVPVGEYREGTVTIDLVDAASDEMVGQAVASSAIVEDDEKLKKRIDQVAAKVFKKLWETD